MFKWWKGKTRKNVIKLQRKIGLHPNRKIQFPISSYKSTHFSSISQLLDQFSNGRVIFNFPRSLLSIVDRKVEKYRLSRHNIGYVVGNPIRQCQSTLHEGRTNSMRHRISPGRRKRRFRDLILHINYFIRAYQVRIDFFFEQQKRHVQNGASAS